MLELSTTFPRIGPNALVFVNKNTVESPSNEPASNGNPPFTESILKSFENSFFYFYVSNKRNPSITNKSVWSLEIR